MSAAADAAEFSEMLPAPPDPEEFPMTSPSVQVGQVRADNDPRVNGRTVKIEAIDGDKALCRVLAAPFDYPEAERLAPRGFPFDDSRSSPWGWCTRVVA